MRPQFKHILDQIVEAGERTQARYDKLSAGFNYEPYLRPEDHYDFKLKITTFYFDFEWRDRFEANADDQFRNNRELYNKTFWGIIEDSGLYEKPSLYDRYQATGGMHPILQLIGDAVAKNTLRIVIDTPVNNYLDNENLENKLADAKAYTEAYSNVIPDQYKNSSGAMVFCNFKEVLMNHYDLILELRKLQP